MNEYLIEIKNLHKYFGKNEVAEVNESVTAVPYTEQTR